MDSSFQLTGSGNGNGNGGNGHNGYVLWFDRWSMIYSPLSIDLPVILSFCCIGTVTWRPIYWPLPSCGTQATHLPWLSSDQRATTRPKTLCPPTRTRAPAISRQSGRAFLSTCAKCTSSDTANPVLTQPPVAKRSFLLYMRSGIVLEAVEIAFS